MTKEEVLNTIIEHYKNGSTSALSDYCDRVRCAECPFNTEDCVDDVAMAILDRLLKAEEHQETNLEHYASKSLTEKYGFSPFTSCDTDTLAITLKDGWEKTFNWSDPIQWLLSPYEEPKPKYKLSKFEYDLLKSYGEETRSTDIFCYFSLTMMREKGYFKDIHVTATFGDVLDNCEVVEDD